jgi:hypothetical protein
MDILNGKFDKDSVRDRLDLAIETAHYRASKREISQAKAFENLVRCYQEFFSDKDSRVSARDDFNAFIDYMHLGGEYTLINNNGGTPQ